MLSRAWSPARRAVFSALGETFLPPLTPGGWHGGDPTSVAITENLYRMAPAILRLAFAVSITVLEWCPFAVVGRWSRFSRMSFEDRLAYLRIFSRRMPFELAFAPLRALVAFTVYSRPDAIAATGYSNVGRIRVPNKDFAA